MTRLERAVCLLVVGVLSFVFLAVIRVEEPKLVKTLRSSPAARGQIQALAEELIKRSSASEKKEWAATDTDFPDEAEALGIKECRIIDAGKGALVLLVPLGDGRAIMVAPWTVFQIVTSKQPARRANPFTNDAQNKNLSDDYIFVVDLAKQANAK